MLHVTRDGSSGGSRRGNSSRMVAMVSAFLLLSAGMVVSLPGLMSASATSGSTGSHSSGGGKDDGSGNGDGHSGCKSGGDDNGSDNSGGDNSGGDNSGGDNSGGDNSKTSSDNSTVSDSQGIASTDNSGTNSGGTDNSGDNSGDKSGGKGGDNSGGNGGGGDNSGGNGGGGDNSGGDNSGHHNGHDDGKDDGDDDDGGNGGGNCLATLTLNKVVVNDNGGTATIADFTLTATSSTGGVKVINGVDPDASTHIGITAKVPVTDTYVLSETNIDGYDASDWKCSAGTLAGDTLTLGAGDSANCTITNDDTPPAPKPTTITVSKVLLDNQWGGTLTPADFQLRIDGNNVVQNTAIPVHPGTHTIGELNRPGYEPAGIACTDLATSVTTKLVADSLDVADGQNFQCAVANQEIPPMLSVTKSVINDNGGNLLPADFQLQIDGADAAQSTGVPVVAVTTHTVGEVATPGYRLVSVICTDDDSHAAVPYNAGVSLVLGQHVTCNLTNDDDPVDLAITKISDGLAKVAGGAPFDYTITVDNLGPRDANVTEPVTVTDQLPAGLTFVTFPANCSTAGQTLTCNVPPADLQVADPPVVIIVTVKANADAPNATYTNMAYVNTADDPACVGNGCLPVCGSASNNVACATTQVVRQAGIAIDKHADVVTTTPGATYSYFITVTNPGPSTYPSGNMSMTDVLPGGISFVSMVAPAPWSCTGTASIACTYNAVLWPGTSAEVITIVVIVDAGYVGPPIVNKASASAVINPPAPLAQALSTDAVPVDPGSTVTVTATDDETTPVVRTADLGIDKSVSQATATAGDQFDWNLAITNHGPDAATNVVVSDTIPAAFEVVGTSAAGGLACTNTGNSVQCTTGSIANGVTVNAVVHVRVAASAAPGVVTNTATVVTDSTDPNTADNTDSASITVTAAGSQAPVPPASGGITGTTPVALPRTGNAPLRTPLTLASLMFVGGIFSLVIARRRRAAMA